MDFILRTEKCLTEEGEVAKESSNQVHDKHGQDGDIGNVLHTFLGGTEGKQEEKSF